VPCFFPPFPFPSSDDIFFYSWLCDYADAANFLPSSLRPEILIRIWPPFLFFSPFYPFSSSSFLCSLPTCPQKTVVEKVGALFPFLPPPPPSQSQGESWRCFPFPFPFSFPGPVGSFRVFLSLPRGRPKVIDQIFLPFSRRREQPPSSLSFPSFPSLSSHRNHSKPRDSFLFSPFFPTRRQPQWTPLFFLFFSVPTPSDPVSSPQVHLSSTITLFFSLRGTRSDSHFSFFSPLTRPLPKLFSFSWRRGRRGKSDNEGFPFSPFLFVPVPMLTGNRKFLFSFSLATPSLSSGLCQRPFSLPLSFPIADNRFFPTPSHYPLDFSPFLVYIQRYFSLFFFLFLQRTMARLQKSPLFLFFPPLFVVPSEPS